MNNLPRGELKVLVLRRRKACLSSCHSALIGNSLLCVASTQISEKADCGCNQHFHGTHHNHQPHGVGAPPKGEGIIEVERQDLRKMQICKLQEQTGNSWSLVCDARRSVLSHMFCQRIPNSNV